jgi:hypothetical protein
MDTAFATRYDPGTSTLEMSGAFDQDAWGSVHEEVERAFRRAACGLTIDMTRVTGVPAHFVGHLVHLCNCCYPGTIVRVAAHRRAA